MTPAAFKRSIRDLQVWCSSCMVAFSGPDPIGVLIGAKRASATLIHRIAVHPDHRRQGHGSHLLTSLSSKLAILGPPRIVAEIPETFAAASGLFGAAGYVQETMLTDYVWDSSSRAEVPEAESRAGEFIIPVTVDDLVANGLLEGDHPQTCWERSAETLTARKEEIAGFAVASDERLEAYVLCLGDEILSLRTLVDDGGSRLRLLLSQLRSSGAAAIRIAKVHPTELSKEFLETLGFRAAGGHRLFAAKARSA